MHMLTYTHTEKRPRWPSLMTEIFQEQLTSPSTMLRQGHPHPDELQLPKGDLYHCLEEKAQHSRPHVTATEHQTGLTCSHRAAAFIWNSTPPLVLAVDADLDNCLACSSPLKRIQEACIHSPQAAFKPLVTTGTTNPPLCLHSHKHGWDKNTFSFILSVTLYCQSRKKGGEDLNEASRVKGWERKGKGSLLLEWLPQWLTLHYLVSHVVLCAQLCLRWAVMG